MADIFGDEAFSVFEEEEKKPKKSKQSKKDEPKLPVDLQTDEK